VVLDAADAAAVGNPDDDGQLDPAPGAVAELGQMAGDLLEGRVGEGVELHLHDRAQAVHRHPDGGADDAGLGQRRIEDPGLARTAASPSVTRKTPPSVPTSSPKTRTESSAASASESAWFRAAAMVTTDPAASPWPRFSDRRHPSPLP
jgi:hypothetical protein